MKPTESPHLALRRSLDMLTLAGGIVLLIALSWEIISGDHIRFSR